MLETLLERPSALKRHREAPLLKEREEFLRRQQQQGTSRAALRNLCGELIPVVRLLRLRKLRDVSPEESHRAAERFASLTASTPTCRMRLWSQHQQIGGGLSLSALEGSTPG